MPIPETRRELIEAVDGSFAKLRAELDRVDEGRADLVCADEWTIRELLAVRIWWTETVVDWIEAGQRGEDPVRPAPGYSWQETPRLNAETAAAARGEKYADLVDRLDRGVARVRKTIDSLDDEELFSIGHFPWAGKWPIARWISLNTARQYTTARTYIRRAMRTVQ